MKTGSQRKPRSRQPKQRSRMFTPILLAFQKVREALEENSKPKVNIGETSAGGWNPQAIYIPRRTKFKGYMRDNRNWGKKRKAA